LNIPQAIFPIITKKAGPRNMRGPAFLHVVHKVKQLTINEHLHAAKSTPAAFPPVQLF